jgi:hypothetical protein
MPWSPRARGPRRGEGGEDAHLPSPLSPLLPSQEQISPPIGPPPLGGVWRRPRRRATGRLLVLKWRDCMRQRSMRGKKDEGAHGRAPKEAVGLLKRRILAAWLPPRREAPACSSA